MKKRGKYFKLIICLVLAVVMVASAFAAGNWYFAARALTEGETGLESEYTPEEGEPSTDESISDAPEAEPDEPVTDEPITEAPVTEPTDAPAPIAGEADEPAAVADEMEVGGTCYALLYSNGDLVFQLSETPDENGRTLKNTYTVDTSIAYEDVLTHGRQIPWYNNRTSVKKVVFADVIRPAKMDCWFYNMTNLAGFEGMENLDTSGVTSLHSTFYYCKSLTELDLSNWKVSNVEDMSYTFYTCDGLTDLDVSNWKTENLTNISNTFLNCSGLTKLDVKDWDVSGVTDMNYTFSSCSSLTELDVSKWIVSGVTSMRYTFQKCSSLTKLDLSDWDVSQVTSLDGTFYSCSALTDLDVSIWKTESVKSMSGTFSGCSGLTVLDVNDWDVSLVTNLNDTFKNCSGLTELDLSNWNTAKNPTTTGMLYNTARRFVLGEHFKFKGNAFDPAYWRKEGTDQSYLDADLCNTYDGSTMAGTYVYDGMGTGGFCYALWYDNGDLVFQYTDEPDENGRTLKESALVNTSTRYTVGSVGNDIAYRPWPSSIKKVIFKDVIKPVNMYHWFKDLTGLTAVENPENLDTSHVTTMYQAFYNCNLLTELDVSSWDVSRVTDMREAFYGCERLIELDMSGWNIADGTNMASAFTESVSRIKLGESFKFTSTTALDEVYWLREGTGEQYLTTDLYKAYNANPADMADTYIKTAMIPGGYCYALLYDNGDLVFQVDNESDSDRGTVTKAYTVNTSKAYARSYSTYTPWYSEKSSVKKVVFADEILPKKLDYWFYDMANLTDVENGTNLKTSAVTSMLYTFSDCKKLTWMDTSGWDLSNVTSLDHAFYKCSALTAMDASNWNLSDKLNSLYYTFYNCNVLTTLTDTSGWDLSNVNTLYEAFYECNKLTELDTSNWGLSSKLTTMYSAFYNCKALTTLGTTDWDLSGLTGTALYETFYCCENLTSLYSTNWGDLSNITSLYRTFINCKALTTLDVSNWKIGNVNTLYSTFNGCESLTNLDVSGWDVSNVTTMHCTFSGCSSLTRLDVSNWKTANVNTLYQTFNGCESLTELNVSDWDVTKVTTLSSTFSGCSRLTSLDLSSWNTESLTTLGNTFQNCSGLTDVNVSGWNVSKVKQMPSIFANCSSLTSLDVSGWDVSNVTSLNETFSGCSSLTSLDLNSWTTDSLTSVSSTFKNCSSLTELNISNWNTAAVTSVQSMIQGCEKLTTLDISGWDTGKVSASNLFYPDAYITTIVADRVYSHLLEITLGPNTDVNSSCIFELGNVENARWVKAGTDTPMTVAEMHAQRRAEPPTEVETWYRVHDVIFDANGGIAVPSELSEWWPGKDIELPTATRRGADFDGWWTEVVGGEELKEGQTPSATKYYAHWVEHKYNLILDSNNGTHQQESRLLEYSESYKLSSTVFTDPWAVITSWNTRPEGTGTTYGANEEIISLTEEDNGEIRLYAQWTSLENIVTITFDSQEGTEVPSRQIERGKAIGTTGKLPTPVKTGFSFAGWYILEENGSLGDKADEKTIVNSDITLVAKWQKDLLVQFDYNMGINSTVISRTVVYGEQVGTLPVDLYNGRYRAFIGWFTEENGGEQISADRVITEDVTFYAHWGWRPRFNANGGKFTNPAYLDDYNITDSSLYLIEEFPDVVYDGYRLVGWYHGDTEVNPGDTVDLSKGTEIYAVWERDNTVKITLLANGGKITRADGNATYESLVYEVYAGKRVAELPIPTRSGYEFLGWADLTGQIPDEYCDKNSVFNQNATLIACWVQQDCTVTFNRVASDARFYNTSAATKTVKVPNGWTVNTLPGCTRLNYILDGWYTEKDGQGDKLTNDTEITGNVTYYANWIPFKETGSTDLHGYTFGVEWENASNANVENVGNNLEFHPTNNNQQGALLHINFELNNSYGEGGALPTGSVYIKIPKYVFYDENGNPINDNDITKWLSKYPTVGSQKFSYIDGGDCYYLVNNQPLDTGGVTLTVEYDFIPNKLKGGAVNEDGRYVDGYDYFYNEIEIEFGINEKPGDPSNPKPWIDPDSQEKRELSVEVHTKVDTTARKTFSSFVYEWRSAWGKKPADADDYFYIIWNLSESYTSNTNQRSTFQWSEDETVHDGTIVYMSSDSGSNAGNGGGSYSCTVVTKHPRELMEDVPTSGRTFYNEAIVTETWASGYETQHRVNASATIYPDDYPWGEFEKDRTNARVIHGGQEDVLDDHKEIEMPWSIWYDGGSNVRPTWNEETNTYEAPNRTIRITDGVRGDLMYSSGRASSPYIWEPNTGNFDLNDDDYYFYSLRISLTEYDAICQDGVWSEKTSNSDLSKYEPIQIWLRYKDTDSFVFYQSIKYTGATTISLPENVVGFQVLHTSEFYWTYLSIRADMRLVPTQKVMTWVQSDVDARTTSIIKNVAKCDIWLTEEGEESIFFEATNRRGDYNSALDDLYELNVSSTSQYTTKSAAEVRIDKDNGAENVPMLIRGYNYNPSGRMKKLKSGVFYDLLPTGTSVDPSTVICIPESSAGTVSVDRYDSYKNSSSKLDTSMYDVRFVQDWEGSGRTMMIIKVAIPENKYPSIAVLYMLHNTYENIRLSGLTVTNDVAFVNTSEGRVWPDSLSGHITVLPQEDQGFYEDLLVNNEGFISFAQASAKFESPAVQSWGFDKRVMTNDEYKVSDSTLPGKTYTYRLSYSQSSSTNSNNMVLYDILEQSARRRDENGNPTDPIPSEWYGTFVSAEVATSFERKQQSTLNPIIYYSTVDRDKFNLEPVMDPADDPMCDLNNSEYWSTEMPEDKSTITAIAVDFSKNTEGKPFTMSGEGTLEVYITMQAPTDVEDFDDKTAYNEGVLYSQQGTATGVTPLYSDSQVTLKDVNPDLEKTADPESGTEEEPTIVEYNQEITYTLKVTNTNEELIMYDIVVEDDVPKGLYIIANEIMVHFGDPSKAVSVATSPRVSMKKADQKLTFTISSLRPGETIHIEIPVIVTVTSAVFKNGAKITEVNGLEKSIESNTTYHEVVPSATTELQIEKKLTGRADPIEEGEFSFIAELIAIDGKAVTPEETELHTYTGSTIGASGWVSMGPIDYEADAEGHVYKYRIAEIVGTDKHIRYSEDVIYALVEIVDANPDDELNAYLVANKTYYSDENCTQQIESTIPTIENKYVDGADIEITKVITGVEKVIEADEFTFTAVEVDNNTLQPITDGRIYHGSTTGDDGRVTFDPIPYDSDDAGKTYTFRITEDKGDEEGMRYSDEVIYAQLTFTLEEDNSLTCKVTYFTVTDNERKPLETPTITNRYSGIPYTLPETGGMGTTLFMIAGTMLVLSAIGIASVTKARKRKYN